MRRQRNRVSCFSMNSYCRKSINGLGNAAFALSLIFPLASPVSHIQSASAFDGVNHRLKPPKSSMVEIEERLKRNPLDPAALCDRGQAYLTAGECELAVVDYSTALKQNAKLSQAYIGRSRANEMIGNHQAALSDVDIAIKIGDKSSLADAMLLKIGILSALNRPAESLPLYEQLITRKDIGVGQSDCINMLHQRSELFLRLNKPELAIKDTETSLLARPYSLSCYLTQGKAYALLKKPDKELVAYSRGITFDTGKLNLSMGRSICQLYLARAKLYRNMGKLALAEADAKKARAQETNIYQDIYDPKEVKPKADRK